MALLAALIAVYAIGVILVPGARADFVRVLVATVPLAVFGHLAASAVALAIGPIQFSTRIRLRHVAVHRWCGRLYLVGVLVGGAGGFRLAFLSQGGTVAHVGFAVLALLWVSTVIRAYLYILEGDIAAHRRWMVRNYSLTFAAVTLRIYLPLSLAAGIPFEVAYPPIAWLCWIPNLIVAAVWIAPSPGRLPGLRRAENLAG